MHVTTEALEGNLSPGDIENLVDQIAARLGGPPDFLLTAYTCHHDAGMLHEVICQSLPDAAVLGSSSCRGVFTNRGVVGFGKPALGVFAIRHPDVKVGCRHAALDAARPVREQIAELIRAAQDDADRSGEVPDLVWLHTSPGLEEDVIQAVQNELGRDILISGGSSADETIEGNWSSFGRSGVAADGVGLALFFVDGGVTHHFENGYVPTGKTGKVTVADGRHLVAIDGRPAADVYNEWTGGLIAEAMAGTSRSILGDSTWSPLGKVRGSIATDGDSSIDYYCLVHPSGVTPDGGLMLFADVEVGEELTLMTGTRESLILRPGSVAVSSVSRAKSDGHAPLGALMVFCAGCMLAIGEDVKDAGEIVSAAYGDTPFLGIFTFGEQGSFLNGQRQHGNLMISSSVLAA